MYATLSEMVARRTFEIGLRVAFGAQPGDVFHLVVKRGVAMALTGVLAGLAAFCLVARLFTDMLYNLATFDPWTIVTASALLVVGLGRGAVPFR